ncbi:MAG: MerR family transcriptional regulator [Clostridium sp.]|uniref:helix-turn-helix domain-containing protein n=1 Tax=Clostridium sp. TaxID=1506 RepID=UPI003EE67D79
MENKLLIGEVAKIFNINIETLRYYDRIDLLKPSFVTDKGYRLYTPNDLTKLKFILGAKKLGVTLECIKKVSASNNLNNYTNLLDLQETLISEKIESLLLLQDYIKQNKSNLTNLVHFTNLYNFTDLQFIEKSISFYKIDLSTVKTKNLTKLFKIISDHNLLNEYYLEYTLAANLYKTNVIYILKDNFSLKLINELESISNSTIYEIHIKSKFIDIQFKGTSEKSISYIKSILSSKNLISSTIFKSAKSFVLQENKQIFLFHILISKGAIEIQ